MVSNQQFESFSKLGAQLFEESERLSRDSMTFAGEEVEIVELL